MKKVVLIISILTSLSLFSQDLSFIKNRSLQQKINNVITFINESPTIRDNYTDNEIFITINGYKSMEVVLETNVNQINKQNRCVKLNERVILVIDFIDEIDDKILDKKRLDKVSDCSCVVKKEKVLEMLNAVFIYNLDEKSDYYYLYLPVTFDRLLYLDIEFREDLSDDD